MTRFPSVVIGLALTTLVSCAPKTTTSVPTPVDPRHPEFLFPKAVPGMADDARIQHENAWRFLQAGDLKAAERGFSQLAGRSPKLQPPLTGLGYTALARKDHKTALEHFNRALASDMRYTPALVGRGQTYLALNDPARALESFDAALAIDPALADVRGTADVLRLKVMQGSVGAARRAAEEGRLADARVAYEQAILSSPQSPFLFREIASVELRESRYDAALAHARKAIELDPNDARNHILLADVLEAMGQLQQALDALTSASAIESSDAVSRHIAALRDKIARDALPESFRAIEATPEITRAQLAALIGVRLTDLVARAPQRSGTLATDIRGHWAADWILPVTRAGFIDVFPNHTFQPEGIVRRGDLARAVTQILNVIAAGNPQLAARLRNARREFTDLPRGHLRHGAASMAVEAGVLASLEDGSFQLTRAVSGAEAVAAVAKLRELAGTRQ